MQSKNLFCEDMRFAFENEENRELLGVMDTEIVNVIRLDPQVSADWIREKETSTKIVNELDEYEIPETGGIKFNPDHRIEQPELNMLSHLAFKFHRKKILTSYLNKGIPCYYQIQKKQFYKNLCNQCKNQGISSFCLIQSFIYSKDKFYNIKVGVSRYRYQLIYTVLSLLTPTAQLISWDFKKIDGLSEKYITLESCSFHIWESRFFNSISRKVLVRGIVFEDGYHQVMNMFTKGSDKLYKTSVMSGNKLVKTILKLCISNRATIPGYVGLVLSVFDFKLRKCQILNLCGIERFQTVEIVDDLIIVIGHTEKPEEYHRYFQVKGMDIETISTPSSTPDSLLQKIQIFRVSHEPPTHLQIHPLSQFILPCTSYSQQLARTYRSSRTTLSIYTRSMSRRHVVVDLHTMSVRQACMAGQPLLKMADELLSDGGVAYVDEASGLVVLTGRCQQALLQRYTIHWC